MRSVFDFIIIPDGKRYNNEIDLNGDKLIVNSSIENFKLINIKYAHINDNTYIFIYLIELNSLSLLILFSF